MKRKQASRNSKGKAMPGTVKAAWIIGSLALFGVILNVIFNRASPTPAPRNNLAINASNVSNSGLIANEGNMAVSGVTPTNVSSGGQVRATSGNITMTASNITNLGNVANTLNIIQTGYIPNTQYTYEDLIQIFPYGYGVVYYDGSKLIRHEERKTGKVEWKIDWENLIFEPNFDEGKVRIYAFPESAVLIDPGSKTQTTVFAFNGVVFEKWISLKAGFGELLIGIVSEGQPAAHVMVLSENQRNPVFAIGFRVAPEGKNAITKFYAPSKSR